jgi:hypothetical protein
MLGQNWSPQTGGGAEEMESDLKSRQISMSMSEGDEGTVVSEEKVLKTF